MMRSSKSVLMLAANGLALVTVCTSASLQFAMAAEPAQTAADRFVFRDVGQSSGLLPQAEGIRGHAAGWGDADGDGWADLYVGTFQTDGARPNLFFRNDHGKFRLDDQPQLAISTRASGVLFVDLDNDGDLDLYVASMPGPTGSELANKQGHAILGCTLFRNDGAGKFTNVSDGNGACPVGFGGRSATVLDFDGDGLLDLLVGEDPHKGYNGSTTTSSRLLRNLGGLQFEDASRAAGLPAGIPGYGVAAADVNNDGWPDIFLAANDGGNRLLLNDGRGHFAEPSELRDSFAWPGSGDDNMVCGICFGDVNRDGLVDLVIGQHFKTPWVKPVANRLYLNRGIKAGVPSYEDVSAKAGLGPLPMKGPHVEIQDFDNDGWPDIYVSIVKFAGGTPHPLIYRNLGVAGDVPKFQENVLALNDFPTAADQAITRSGELFDKVLRDKKIIYSAPGPSADFDNDGRLDLFLASWWPQAPSLLLKNETPGGNWLQMQVEGSGQVNRQAIGSRVRVYPAGKLNDAAALLGSQEIAVGYGYTSGQTAIAHFGLGKVERVDVEVQLPHGKGIVVRKDVPANQRLTIKQ